MSPVSHRKHITLYATFPSKQGAEQVIDALLEARLIACANLLGEIISYYRWEGKCEHSEEVALLLKTTQENQEKVIELIAREHPYKCPCVTVWPIEGGHPAYLRWIDDETGLQS